MKKKTLSTITVALVLGGSSIAAPMIASAGPKIPALSYKGTITMYAQGFTPDVPGVYLAPNSPKLHMLENAAMEFEKLYPGIKIKFVNSNTYGSVQWYETQAAAGLLPDIVFVPISYANATLPSGMFTNLAPYFNEPNPFIPGNKRWSAIMNPRVLGITRAPGGEQYVLDGAWVATAFYYNKNLFKKAGITTVPHNWAQLVADTKKLKAHGIDPGAMSSQYMYSWWNRIFNANAVGKKEIAKLLAFTHSVGIVNQVDEVQGYAKGILNPAKNPAITAWWPAMKDLLSQWDKTVLEVPPNSTSASAPTPENYFSAQKVAMVYDGSWLPPILHSLPKKQQFPYGTFTISNLKGTSKYATNLVTSQDVGGPGTSYEYAVSTHKSDNTMTPAKLQAVMAWMQFMGTPQWDAKMVNEQGDFIPTFKGAKVPPSEASIARDLTKPWYDLDLFENLTGGAGTQIDSVFQEYVTGQISFQSAVQQYEQAVSQAVQQFKQQNSSTPS